ncbi:MAG TPA: hypothetical protein VJM50_19945 [Pyrinomonadaceae bacterium]|nr:hypothetical protein [Pyrinomonadaceae bacterium]
MANGLQEVVNYLIPQVGSPRCFVVSQVLGPTPYRLDFRSVPGGMIDGQPFRPSGVFIDNTAGAGDLEILVNEINYNMLCPAGDSLNAQFPAVMDSTFNITGDGQATIVFVDFPVMPYRSF